MSDKPSDGLQSSVGTDMHLQKKTLQGNLCRTCGASFCHGCKTTTTHAQIGSPCSAGTSFTLACLLAYMLASWRHTRHKHHQVSDSLITWLAARAARNGPTFGLHMYIMYIANCESVKACGDLGTSYSIKVLHSSFPAGVKGVASSWLLAGVLGA